MTRKIALWVVLASIVGLPLCARSANPAAVALTGRVSSEAEGFMEGVLVSTKAPGSTIRLTVVSDHDGRYAFPASRLKPGKYNLSIRAIGYELADSVTVNVTDGVPAQFDLKLVKTDNLVPQMTSAEWLLSVPGTEQQKNELYPCANCHSLRPVVQSVYDADSWLPTLVRMRNWSPQSALTSPVRIQYKVNVEPSPAFAKYLSTINLSSTQKWPYELKTLPRPTGRATRVIVTEYDLPDPSRMPHDAVLESNGMIWYNDFQKPLIGRVDPRTGETKEWRFPPLKPGFAVGTLSIMFDREGYLWVSRYTQGGITRFDPRTEKFQTWLEPAEYNTEHSSSPHIAPAPDGTVWLTENEGLVMSRLDPKSGHITSYSPYSDYHPDQSTFGGGGEFKVNGAPEGHRTYGIAVDSKSNGYFLDIIGGNIGKVDAKTGEISLYKTPTLNSGPRRGIMDPEDRLWFGEYNANRLGMFDTHTKQFKEWPVPTPWTGPYPAIADKNGEAWTAGMGTDYIVRLNPQTGRFTEYLLPTVDANIRWINVDNSATPVAIWVGEVHQGKIAKIEPLD